MKPDFENRTIDPGVPRTNISRQYNASRQQRNPQAFRYQTTRWPKTLAKHMMSSSSIKIINMPQSLCEMIAIRCSGPNPTLGGRIEKLYLFRRPFAYPMYKKQQAHRNWIRVNAFKGRSYPDDSLPAGHAS